MLKMVDGTGIIGVDMICPLGVSTPQPPNYDRVELEGTGMLVLPNSLDAPLERLELGGKTEQVQTSGKNLFPDKFSIYAEGKSKTNLKLQIGNYVYSSKTSKNLYILHEDKSNITNGWTATNKFNFKIDKEETIEVRIETENPLEILPMIREETELDSYEPYTGGKPSPSSEYPQEIKNSGKWNEETRKYEVDIEISGNFFDVTKVKTKTNLINNGDGSLLVINKSTIGSELFGKLCPDLKVGETCVMRLESTGLSYISINGMVWDTGQAKTITQNILDSTVYFYGKDGSTVVIKNIRITRNTGKNMEYTPYRKPQLLTLTSDRPLTKWDRLVEQGGQIGWLYQSKIASLTGKEEWKSSLNAFYTTAYNFMRNDKAKCSHYVLGGITNQEKNNIFSIGEGAYANSLWVRDTSFGTIQDFKEHLSDLNEKGAPIMVVSPSAQTEFVPLPQPEQNAIRALKTYYPTTVITVDGGELDPDIKVTYRKEI